MTYPSPRTTRCARGSGGMPWRVRVAGLLGWTAIALACAGPPPATTLTAAVARTDERLAALVRDAEAPGIQYAAFSAERVFVTRARGVRDSAFDAPMTTDTRLLTCSVTKFLTAIAVLQLVSDARLALDDSLERFVPEHPYGSGITVRHLLSHTSGLPNPLPLDWFVAQGDASDGRERLRRVMRENPELDHAPGDAYQYSNLGYWLLEYVIEAASGQSYQSVIEERVLAMVGLAPDSIVFVSSKNEAQAGGHDARGHLPRYSALNAVLFMMSPGEYWLAPSRGFSRFARAEPFGLAYGAIWASAETLSTIMRDLLASRSHLLSNDVRALLFQPVRTKSEGLLARTVTGLAMGEVDGVPYVGKQGGGLGFQGNIRFYPTLGLGSVYLANSAAVSEGPIDERSDLLDRPFLHLEGHDE